MAACWTLSFIRSFCCSSPSHYIFHTIQNFRFIYDLPSLAFFTVGLWLIYFRKHPLWFAALFLVATLNRETTLLLLPFFMLSEAAKDGDFDLKRDWRKAFAPRVLAVVLPLAAAWWGWHDYVFHLYRHNISEYYPRISLNFYTFIHPPLLAAALKRGGLPVSFRLFPAPHCGRRSASRLDVGIATLGRMHVLLGHPRRNPRLRRVAAFFHLPGGPRCRRKNRQRCSATAPDGPDIDHTFAGRAGAAGRFSRRRERRLNTKMTVRRIPHASLDSSRRLWQRVTFS